MGGKGISLTGTLLLGLLLLGGLPAVLGVADCGIQENCTFFTPVLTCPAYNYTVYNGSNVRIAGGGLTLVNGSLYQFSFNASQGQYVALLCDNSTKQISVEGEDMSASLSIILFFLAIPSFLIALPWLVGRFSRSELLDMATKRFCWILGIYLLTLAAAVLGQIANQSGIDVMTNITFYIKTLTYAAYLFIVYMAVKLIFDLIEMGRAKKNAKQQRTSDGNDEESSDGSGEAM